MGHERPDRSVWPASGRGTEGAGGARRPRRGWAALRGDGDGAVLVTSGHCDARESPPWSVLSLGRGARPSSVAPGRLRLSRVFRCRDPGGIDCKRRKGNYAFNLPLPGLIQGMRQFLHNHICTLETLGKNEGLRNRDFREEQKVKRRVEKINSADPRAHPVPIAGPHVAPSFPGELKAPVHFLYF